jgi:hypothetical protein
MLIRGAVDRILWMGVLCLVMWCAVRTTSLGTIIIILLLLLFLWLLLRSSYFAWILLDIVNLGGLPLIVSLCRHFENDTDVTIKLVKVLSNISMQDGMLQHFFVTGKTLH